MPEKSTFSAADYGVFGGMLLISAGIGVYHAVAGGGQKSTSSFLMANRSMNFLPVALSVLASFFSASTLLGTPAEIYQFGTMFWISIFGAVLTPITGAYLFGPMFFNLKVISVFEYLEKRFKSRLVRRFGAFIFILRASIGMGIVLYGPSTALSAVTNFPEWAIIITIGAVCTFYTSIGGIKAVIWTDVFQTLIMVAGMLTVFIKACVDIGIGDIWQRCENAGRISFFEFNVDPHIRHSFWSLTLGIYFVWLPPYTVDQQMVQRFSSTKSLKHAKLALLTNVPGMFIIITLCCLVGLAMFAHYEHCDPLKTKQIENANQLLPFFVMDILGSYPGVPGLFVASLFSGALSSVSSMLNSLAAVTWEDFLKLRYSHFSDSKAATVTKLLAVAYGFLGVGVAFLVARLGGTVLQASLTLNGAAGAPLVGIFILGACFTSANWCGAFVGGLVGFALSMWLSVGAYVTRPLDFRLPTSDSMCNATYYNASMDTFPPAIPVDTSQLVGLEKLYGLSYIWFSSLGILTSVVIGLIISWLTGPTKASDVDESLQLRLVERMSTFCRKNNITNKQKAKERWTGNPQEEKERELSYIQPDIHTSADVHDDREEATEPSKQD